MSGPIRRIGSGGIYEDKIGYARAVSAGGWIHVSGTTAQGETIPDDVVDQCRTALETIRGALARFGADFTHVVRVAYILPDPAEFAPCWPLLSETFGAHPPAATMIAAALIDPKYRIEIEVTAYTGP